MLRQPGITPAGTGRAAGAAAAGGVPAAGGASGAGGPSGAGAAPARSHSARDRDAGLWLIGRINRWMISGAIAISGLLSFVAAHAFHGHTSTAGSAAPAAASSAAGSSASGSSGSSASGNSGSGASSGSGSGGSLQQPSQAPTPSSAAPSAAVSGGS